MERPWPCRWTPPRVFSRRQNRWRGTGALARWRAFWGAPPSPPGREGVGRGSGGGLGGRVIVDEIYQGLVDGSTPRGTALALSDRVFVVNSFSKYFGMTGWRLGWLVAPTEYLPALDRLAQNLFLAASTPAQYAALAAFHPETCAILEERRREFEQRRDELVPALTALGFDVPTPPDGAFYVYAECARHTDDSHAFALALLEQAGVCGTPGIDFGTHRSRSHLRFAYTTGREQLGEGMRRLQRFIAG